ncbi:cytochrome P450 [Coprinopsis cinerea okayama7|uniref:Cytochrome P450 n=1 Tax=Coprinopsis cinerea (strain Okayama-7 / 130 / ATCC MYA-4618 / FGSC 9003) TaxID=240176 RepID=A8NI98_COPC7|nr:cytochrome P450 [Coprinopsis cinerea okayama7\|eukprot:XP_001833945.2 cytochrome P450 [Coprinopsis cinerea okayama7\
MYSPLQILGIGLATWLLYQWYLFHATRRKVQHIPTVGGDGFISSYISGWKFLVYGHHMVEEGYKKYPGRAFKIPTVTTPNRWMIVLSGPEMVGDIKKATPDQLSFPDAAFELLHSDHTFGTKNCRLHPYHIETVRGPLTRAFPSRFGELKEEMVHSFSQFMPATTDWTPYTIMNTLTPIISRTSNRLFVGLPLCRNSEYCSLLENLTIHTFVVANILNLLPESFRPIIGRLVSRFPGDLRRLRKHVDPLFIERKELDAMHGSRKWEGRPSDIISWLLDTVPEELDNLNDLALRLVAVNIAAIHTTTITLSNTLFELASRHEYIAPLREEIDQVLKEYGWTKEGMGKMRKLDSFIKEVSRLHTLSAVSIQRKSRVDYKLSDGTVIPAGFRVAAASSPSHCNPNEYEDPMSFNGFRFSEIREDAKENQHHRNQLVSLDANFLFFGHGRSACPGRFFAASEMKAIMSHILMNYDIKLENDSTTPPSHFWYATLKSPSPTGRVLFRKRSDVE